MTYDGSHALQPGSTLGAGRYVLKRPLGQGGMGIVWLAQDQRLEEAVALKLVPPEIRSDAGALEDLRQETLRSRRLSHPNIIRLHDLNEFPDEPPFISMEYVDGQTVAAWKAQQPQRLIAWEQLRPLIRQLCDALEYAHGEKVIHRDLKPANMMLDSRGRLKLADFGLAAMVSELTSRVSQKPNTSGTPAYMSPQQMDGRTPRVTDDVYALGATLYELLTSKPPFYHGDIPHQVRNLPVDPVEQRLAELTLTNNVPPGVSALVMACLAKDPSLRPQSAVAVAEQLDLGGGMKTGAWAASPISTSSQPAVIPVVETSAKSTSRHEPGLSASTDRQNRKWSVALVMLVLVGLAMVVRNFTKDKTVREMPPVVMFNTRDLQGWSVVGPKVWRVEDGVIKAASRETTRSYLVWNSGITNFDLTFGYKPVNGTGPGHHGLFYRATMPTPGGTASGLAMPLDPTQGAGKGALLVGDNGNFVTQNPFKLEPLRLNDWNQIRVWVEGSKILQSINGVITYEAERPDLLNNASGHQLAFEIWNAPGGERSIEIRNLILRPLQPLASQKP